MCVCVLGETALLDVREGPHVQLEFIPNMDMITKKCR